VNLFTGKWCGKNLFSVSLNPRHYTVNELLNTTLTLNLFLSFRRGLLLILAHRAAF
jgi:hypothetical protein